MRTLGLALVVCLIGSAAEAAECKVEDWRWYHTEALRALGVEGVATCDSGRIAIRAYDQRGDKRKFLGVEDTFIENRAFKMTIFAVDPRPKNPVVEFTIKPDTE